MTKIVLLPETIISDKRSAFVSQKVEEVAGVSGITLLHDTTKHAQAINA